MPEIWLYQSFLRADGTSKTELTLKLASHMRSKSFRSRVTDHGLILTSETHKQDGNGFLEN